MDLSNKTAKEKAKLKGQEIAKIKKLKKTKRGKYHIEIVDIKAIEGGVEVFARAWENGKQIGFGKDGSVDIERFRIINPPVLVDDPNGDIIREYIDEDGVTKQRKLREDPHEALLQSLEHTISVKKEKFNDSNIVKGKIGNTTSTFYPSAGSSSPVDGWGRVLDTSGQSWSVMRSLSATATGGDNDTSLYIGYQDDETNDEYTQIYRAITLFDTSSIPDTDAISSATYSLYGQGRVSSIGSNPNYNVYSASTASSSTLTNADFNIGSFGFTQLATGIAHNSLSITGYNDWSLNASGISNISKTGVSKFGALLEGDASNSAPGTTNNGSANLERMQFHSADASGTSNDPKLVVEHSAAASRRIFIIS